MKANMYYNSQLYSQAIDYFVKEIEANNKATKKQAMMKLANCYNQTGAFIEAEKVYRSLMVNYGKREPIFIFEYANALRSSSKYAEAIEAFEEYKKARPNDPMTDQAIQSCIMAEMWLVEPGNYYVRNLRDFNSTAADACPIAYGDTLFFSSSRQGSVKKIIDLKEGGKSTMLDLYYVNIQDTNSTVSNKGYLKGLNTYMHEGPACFSPDRNIIYFTRTVRGRKTKKKATPVALQIYMSQKTSSGEWGVARSALKINNLKYSVAHPSISEDGKSMYFASDMKGGSGGTDIYVTERSKSGQWEKPRNLGEVINTFGNELTPFIYHDTILFFSSDAHPGMGKKDIFMSVYSNGEWQEVVNLKPPINSLANDFGFVQYPDEGKGYFTSDRFNGIGGEDIYSFIELTPLVLELDTNVFTIEDQSFFNEASYQLADDVTKVKEDVLTNGKAFKFSITDTTKYTLYERREGISYNKVSIDIDTDIPDAYYVLTVRAGQVPVRFKGKAYVYEKTEFKSIDTSYVIDSFKVLPNAYVSVSLKDKILYEGNADENGNYEIDFDLKPRKRYNIKVHKDTKNLYKIDGLLVSDEAIPVRMANIVMFDMDGKELQKLKTDMEGKFMLSASKDKEYIIAAQKTGYNTKQVKIGVVKDDRTTISKKIVIEKQAKPATPTESSQSVANEPVEVAMPKPITIENIAIEIDTNLSAITKNDSLTDDIFYSIQVLASIQDRPSLKVKQELSLADSIMKFETNGIYHYTLQKFDNVDSAKFIRDIDYKKYGATVVKVVNGKVFSINSHPGETVVEGKILDERAKPVKANIDFNESETNRLYVRTASDEESGKYQATLKDGNRYSMVVTKDDYVFHSENINLTDTRSPEESEGQLTKNISMQPIKPGASIVLNNIFFDYGKSTINDNSIPELERIVKLMKENPQIRVEISGHTCNISSWQFNKKLSQYRAYAVKDYLVARGISPSRLVSRGYSFDKGIADNSTEAGRVKNRRTEFRIIQ